MIAKELYDLMYEDIKSQIAEMFRGVSDEWLGIKDASVIIGWSIKTMYKRIDEIPHTKVGRKYRFKKSELNKFLERNKFLEKNKKLRGINNGVK